MEKENVKYQRPWGYYIILSDREDHKVKRIKLKPGRRTSLQTHQKRTEHWYVVSGEASVRINDREVKLKSGEAIDIPLKAVHRIENTGDKHLVFIEVQTGEYFGEDDIERLEDDFGRARSPANS